MTGFTEVPLLSVLLHFKYIEWLWEISIYSEYSNHNANLEFLSATAPHKTLHSSSMANVLLTSVIILSIPFLFWDPAKLLRFRLTPFLWDIGHLVMFFAVGWLV